MKQELKLILIGSAMLAITPLANAAPGKPVTAAFNYDRTAPVKTTYRKAQKTARKACKINGRITAMQRMLERDSVQPMLEEFVLRTQSQDLITYHEARTGNTITANQFVAD